MFDFSGAFYGPIRKRPVAFADAEAPDIQPDNATPPQSFLDYSAEPERPGYGSSFLAGMQQNRGRNPLLGGLSGWAGAGGFRGALGNVARFLL